MSEPEQGASLPKDIFLELISTRSLRKQHLSPAASPSEPLYCIAAHKTLSSKKPDLVLHSGSTKSGPVLGVVKFGLRVHDIGIGDPDSLFEEGSQDSRVVWEHMRRIKTWGARIYEFEYGAGVGAAGAAGAAAERIKYRWTWTNKKALGVPYDMELRVVTPVGEDEGELLAVFKRNDWKSIYRGSLFINTQYCSDETEEGKRWKLMVLLTGLCILEGINRSK